MESVLGCVSSCADCLPDTPCTGELLGDVLPPEASAAEEDRRTRWTQEREAEYRGHAQTDMAARERVAHHVASSAIARSAEQRFPREAGHDATRISGAEPSGREVSRGRLTIQPSDCRGGFSSRSSSYISSCSFSSSSFDIYQDQTTRALPPGFRRSGSSNSSGGGSSCSCRQATPARSRTGRLGYGTSLSLRPGSPPPVPPPPTSSPAAVSTAAQRAAAAARRATRAAHIAELAAAAAREADAKADRAVKAAAEAAAEAAFAHNRAEKFDREGLRERGINPGDYSPAEAEAEGYASRPSGVKGSPVGRFFAADEKGGFGVEDKGPATAAAGAGTVTRTVSEAVADDVRVPLQQLMSTSWTETTTPTAADVVETMASLLSSARSRSTSTSVQTFLDGAIEEYHHQHFRHGSAAASDLDGVSGHRYPTSPYPTPESAAGPAQDHCPDKGSGRGATARMTLSTSAASSSSSCGSPDTDFSSSSSSCDSSRGKIHPRDGGRGPESEEAAGTAAAAAGTAGTRAGNEDGLLDALAADVERSSAWLKKPSASPAASPAEEEVEQSPGRTVNPTATGVDNDTATATATATTTVPTSSPRDPLTPKAPYIGKIPTATTPPGRPSALKVVRVNDREKEKEGLELPPDASESEVSAIMITSIFESQPSEASRDISLAEFSGSAATAVCCDLATSSSRTREDTVGTRGSGVGAGGYRRNEGEVGPSPSGKAWAASCNHKSEGQGAELNVEVKVEEGAAARREGEGEAMRRAAITGFSDGPDNNDSDVPELLIPSRRSESGSHVVAGGSPDDTVTSGGPTSLVTSLATNGLEIDEPAGSQECLDFDAGVVEALASGARSVGGTRRSRKQMQSWSASASGVPRDVGDAGKVGGDDDHDDDSFEGLKLDDLSASDDGQTRIDVQGIAVPPSSSTPLPSPSERTLVKTHLRHLQLSPGGRVLVVNRADDDDGDSDDDGDGGKQHKFVLADLLQVNEDQAEKTVTLISRDMEICIAFKGQTLALEQFSAILLAPPQNEQQQQQPRRDSDTGKGAQRENPERSGGGGEGFASASGDSEGAQDNDGEEDGPIAHPERLVPTVSLGAGRYALPRGRYHTTSAFPAMRGGSFGINRRLELQRQHASFPRLGLSVGVGPNRVGGGGGSDRGARPSSWKVRNTNHSHDGLPPEGSISFRSFSPRSFVPPLQPFSLVEGVVDDGNGVGGGASADRRSVVSEYSGMTAVTMGSGFSGSTPDHRLRTMDDFSSTSGLSTATSMNSYPFTSSDLLLQRSGKGATAGSGKSPLSMIRLSLGRQQQQLQLQQEKEHEYEHEHEQGDGGPVLHLPEPEDDAAGVQGLTLAIPSPPAWTTEVGSVRKFVHAGDDDDDPGAEEDILPTTLEVMVPKHSAHAPTSSSVHNVVVPGSAASHKTFMSE